MKVLGASSAGASTLPTADKYQPWMVDENQMDTFYHGDYGTRASKVSTPDRDSGQNLFKKIGSFLQEGFGVTPAGAGTLSGLSKALGKVVDIEDVMSTVEKSSRSVEESFGAVAKTSDDIVKRVTLDYNEISDTVIDIEPKAVVEPSNLPDVHSIVNKIQEIPGAAENFNKLYVELQQVMLEEIDSFGPGGLEFFTPLLKKLNPESVNASSEHVQRKGEGFVSDLMFRFSVLEPYVQDMGFAPAERSLPDTAVHEMGHVLMALINKVGDVKNVGITTDVPLGSAGLAELGSVYGKGGNFLHKEYMETLLGGKAGERLMFGNLGQSGDVGSADDIEKALHVGIDYFRKTSKEDFDAASLKEKGEMIDSLMLETFTAAKNKLENNISVFQKLSAYLLHKKSMTGFEIDDILKQDNLSFGKPAAIDLVDDTKLTEIMDFDWDDLVGGPKGVTYNYRGGIQCQ